MTEQMYLRNEEDFELFNKHFEVAPSDVPQIYPCWIIWRHAIIYNKIEVRGEPYEVLRDITQNVLNGTFKFIDYNKLAQFTDDNVKCDWDIPIDGCAVISVEDPQALDLFLEANIISINQRDPHEPYTASKYVVEQHSQKYDSYKYTISGEVFGAQLWEGAYSWKQLKLHTFLHNRIGDNKKLQQLHDKLGLLTEVYNEDFFSIETSLEVGYDETNVDSCMQNHGNYFRNFEDAGVLLKYNNGVDGRAIIWSDQYIKGLPEGCQGFMDRIYPSSNHKVVNAYKAYAEAHNLICKAEQNYEVKERFIWRNEPLRLHLVLTPPNFGSSERYPYMDTFTYTGDFRSFSNTTDGSRDIELTDTDGHHSDSYTCCNCDCSMDDDGRYCDDNGNDWCPDCYHCHHSECSCCGDYTDNDYIRESDDGDICESCVGRRDYKYCEDIEMYSQDYVIAKDSGKYWHSTKDLYYAEDAEEWYEFSGSLTLAYDSKLWYSSIDSLYFAVDIEEYYDDEDNLVLTVDTNSYFAGTDGLFEHNDEYYEKEQ